MVSSGPLVVFFVTGKPTAERERLEVKPGGIVEILKTHIGGLDDLLRGGVRFPPQGAAFVLISGGPGTGKSLLGLELSVKAFLEESAEERWIFYYSVEEPPGQLRDRVFKDFDCYGIEAPVEEVPTTFSKRLHLRCRQSHLVFTLIEPFGSGGGGADDGSKKARTSFEWINQEVENYASTYGNVHLICVDNLSVASQGMPDGQRRAELARLRHLLLRRRVHGVFVVEETEAGFGGLAEQYVADVMVHLGYRVYDGYFKERCIEVAKARHQYYYRGPHHFSIVGTSPEGVRIGARGEKAPGIHVYPSMPAQLSMIRDRSGGRVPPRGEGFFSTGSDAADRLLGGGVIPRSSTLLLTEEETPGTLLGLQFLAAGLRRGARGLLISLSEDEDAVARICARTDGLSILLGRDQHTISPDMSLYHLGPEYITPGKFLKDIEEHLHVHAPDETGGKIELVVFDNISHVRARFPLLRDAHVLVPAMIEYFRHAEVTPFFIMISGREDGAGPDGLRIAGMFDNVLVGRLLSPDRSELELKVRKSLSSERRKDTATWSF